MTRAETIKGWISSRKERQTPTNCIFDISIPYYSDEMPSLDTYEPIKTVIKLLEKYNIQWTEINTVPGTYNLNKPWLETTDIPCYIEYNGVYPANWDIDDIVTLESLEYNGDIIIRVSWHIDDEYIPNH